MLNLYAFITYVFIVTFTPGPNNIMTMAHSSKYGLKKTLRFIFGVITGFFAIILFSSYFNLLLFDYIPKVKKYMSIIASIYMLYLAYKIIKSKPSSSENSSTELSYKSGIVLQFINAKFIMYAVTVTSTFIVPFYNENYQLVLFTILLTFIAFLSLISWGLLGSFFNKFLNKYYKPFNIFLAALLIYTAISISDLFL
ncbi:LysE family transporter [Helicovermis profundi]|uniref:LysE family transporter n=1 Tax=Helicovermis profundi TaxID=3065157 RepID=A0AAU9E189_9FIRM|nr:LysE family transporter [Clostridia bacterium S502]